MRLQRRFVCQCLGAGPIGLSATEYLLGFPTVVSGRARRDRLGRLTLLGRLKALPLSIRSSPGSFEPSPLAAEIAGRELPSNGNITPVIYRLNLRAANSFFRHARSRLETRTSSTCPTSNSASDPVQKFLRSDRHDNLARDLWCCNLWSRQVRWTSALFWRLQR
jgi:hypothetical protein